MSQAREAIKQVAGHRAARMRIDRGEQFSKTLKIARLGRFLLRDLPVAHDHLAQLSRQLMIRSVTLRDPAVVADQPGQNHVQVAAGDDLLVPDTEPLIVDDTVTGHKELGAEVVFLDIVV